jgi:hypothetical protein
LYARVIDRVRRGETFYSAYGDELRRGHYPIASVIGWRTPLLYIALARVPDRIARSAMRITMVAAIGVGIWAAAPVIPRILVGVLLAGALGSTWDPAAPLFTEAWAAILMTISVGLYLRGKDMPGATVALVALFIRELVGPYVAVCAVSALRRRRWNEIALWAIGAAAYMAYYAWHIRAVHAHQLPTDAALVGPWTRGGGLSFLLLTLRANVLLINLPAIVLVVLLVFAIIALRRTPPSVAASLVIYTTVFLFVGDASRAYWGTVTAPLWAFTWPSLLDRKHTDVGTRSELARRGDMDRR